MVDHPVNDRLFDSFGDVPHRKVGLALGTSPITTQNGHRNYYFDHRIKPVTELYKAGKVDQLVYLYVVMTNVTIFLLTKS